MKRILLMAVLVIFIACSEAEKSPTETAQIVVESFYEKDLPTLKEYTTEESYQAFMNIQDMFTATETENSNFKVLQETENGDIAWVQFKTNYEENPETFKLIKENGSWKVTEIGMGEKAPF
ncbi:DUF4878 domain-containing protein [Salegentibacter mishustinae]|uniref:DUF4878 domain-containing protein n=1 Tax=Salegentibacter mishustinae TaxID=270918 RepID=UPI001CE0FE07|nr:DUF4878 domain-containing protein [Salegentibacter mishustinae]UBZ08779.1 DUF4878 domain-containing protein [Salegentibacter mishustinae]